MSTTTILTNIRADVALITTANGYNTNLVKSHSVSRELNDLTIDEFDSFYLESGTAQMIDTIGGKALWNWAINGRFYLMVNEDVGGGGLTTKIELLKTDLVTLYKHWLNDDGSVTLPDASGFVKVSLPTLYSYYDDGDTKGELGMTLEVRYLE